MGCLFNGIRQPRAVRFSSFPPSFKASRGQHTRPSGPMEGLVRRLKFFSPADPVRTSLGEAWWGRVKRASKTSLGEAWWSRVCNSAEKGDERLCAAHNLADCCGSDGKHADAERINRARRWVLGEEHSATLTSDLASSLSGQGKYAEAERIEREVLGVLRRVLGE